MSAMHCLLCHEKIPRLRAWTKKSEFCSDEHAALYKRQTLERLLPDPKDDEQAIAAPLFIDSLADNGQQPTEAQAVLVSELQSTPAAPPAPPPPSAGEVDELWRLADQVGEDESTNIHHLPAISEPAADARTTDSGSAAQQTAEEALEALRQLASKVDLDQLEELPSLEDDPSVSLDALLDQESTDAATALAAAPESAELDLESLEAEHPHAAESLDACADPEPPVPQDLSDVEPPELLADFDDATDDGFEDLQPSELLVALEEGLVDQAADASSEAAPDSTSQAESEEADAGSPGAKVLAFPDLGVDEPADQTAAAPSDPVSTPDAAPSPLDEAPEPEALSGQPSAADPPAAPEPDALQGAITAADPASEEQHPEKAIPESARRKKASGSAGKTTKFKPIFPFADLAPQPAGGLHDEADSMIQWTGPVRASQPADLCALAESDVRMSCLGGLEPRLGAAMRRSSTLLPSQPDCSEPLASSRPEFPADLCEPTLSERRPRPLSSLSTTDRAGGKLTACFGSLSSAAPHPAAGELDQDSSVPDHAPNMEWALFEPGQYMIQTPPPEPGDRSRASARNGTGGSAASSDNSSPASLNGAHPEPSSSADEEADARRPQVADLF